VFNNFEIYILHLNSINKSRFCGISSSYSYLAEQTVA